MPYRKSSNDLDAVMIKAIAQIITALIMFVLAYTWEFALNPGGNYSIETHKDDVVMVSGIDCHGDDVRWYLLVAKTWYSNKKTRAIILAWRESQGRVSTITELEVSSDGDLKLGSCTDEAVDVAYIWTINSSNGDMHLRVHPQFDVRVDADVKIPEKVFAKLRSIK